VESLNKYIDQISNVGFTIIENLYTIGEVEEILAAIDNTDQSKITFRKTSDLFAIRRFLKEAPGVSAVIFNNKLNWLSVCCNLYFYYVCFIKFILMPEEENIQPVQQPVNTPEPQIIAKPNTEATRDTLGATRPKDTGGSNR
jgi:hypothetical protein